MDKGFIYTYCFDNHVFTGGELTSYCASSAADHHLYLHLSLLWCL